MSCLVASAVAGCVVVAIGCSLLISISLLAETPSTLDSRHQLLNLRLLLAGERQEWQARRASIIAVEVHGVLHAGDAEFADHALGGEFHTLLFFAGERGVSVLERGVDFVARSGRRTGEGKNGADRSQSERRFELVSGSDHDPEPDLFLPRFQFSYNSYSRGRRLGSAFCGDGRGRPSLHFNRARQRGYAYQFPALLFTLGSGGLEHPRSHGLERLGHGNLSLHVARALDHRFHFVEVTARLLDRCNVGMSG